MHARIHARRYAEATAERTMEMWERFVIVARAQSLALRRDWAMFSDDLTSGYLASKLEDATRAQLDVWQLQWQQQWAYASSRCVSDTI